MAGVQRFLADLADDPVFGVGAVTSNAAAAQPSNPGAMDGAACPKTPPMVKKDRVAPGAQSKAVAIPPWKRPAQMVTNVEPADTQVRKRQRDSDGGREAGGNSISSDDVPDWVKATISNDNVPDWVNASISSDDTPDWVKALREERLAADAEGLKWRDRGPAATEEVTRWRGQQFRAGSDRWANRGGANKDWWTTFYRARKVGATKESATEQADAKHGPKV